MYFEVEPTYLTREVYHHTSYSCRCSPWVPRPGSCSRGWGSRGGRGCPPRPPAAGPGPWGSPGSAGCRSSSRPSQPPSSRTSWPASHRHSCLTNTCCVHPTMVHTHYFIVGVRTQFLLRSAEVTVTLRFWTPGGYPDNHPAVYVVSHELPHSSLGPVSECWLQCASSSEAAAASWQLLVLPSPAFPGHWPTGLLPPLLAGTDQLLCNHAVHILS